MILLPIIGFSQDKKVIGKYRELSAPSKVVYKFRDNRFIFISKTDIGKIQGKGKYRIKEDSLFLYFDKWKNESIVKYRGEKHISTKNSFQFSIIDDHSKSGFVGAKVQCFSHSCSLIYENYLNENGELNFAILKNIESIKISYIAYPDLIINVDTSFNFHRYNILWKSPKYTVIDGHVWQYEINNITKRSFYLKKGNSILKYKKCAF
jgi:hypothetical protein